MIELFSHPDQSLRKHLAGVLEMSVASLENRRASGWDPIQLNHAVNIAAIFHDFAKATSYFQTYITSEKKRKTAQSSHTMLSAIVSYYVAMHVLQGEEEEVLLSSFFVFMAVRRHHGNIHEFNTEINALQDKRDLLLQQAAAIQYDEWNKIVEMLSSELPFSLQGVTPFTVEKVQSWVNTFYDEIGTLRRWLKKRYGKRNINNGLSDYFKYCVLYSLLLDGDKNQAALRDMMYHGRRLIAADTVDHYKRQQQWDASSMNNLREQAYEEVSKIIDTAGGRLFSINLPTGMGKTITSLNAALRLRARRQHETGIAPRIIYSLPFLSVIDQNFSVFEKILQTGIDKLDYSYLIKHHSLIDPYEQVNAPNREKDEQEEYNFDQAQILVEGWNSEIICTTFVQVFQTLLTNRNKALRKFHRFSHAIIVLDEVQAIPVKYWALMREMILELTRGMNTDVILLTATEPKIFSQEDVVVSLCDRDRYFSEMNRISIIPCIKEKMTVQQFAESLELDNEKSYLFILNTIDAAKELHAILSKNLEEDIGFLSTHIVPKQRLQRIKEIQKGKYRIVVSTQLVEAGVDIDFDIVYRDLAPLDSINQSAGRCNRHNRRTGTLYVVNLCKGERMIPYAQSIYGRISLEVTKSILNKHEEIPEPLLLPLIENYFDEVKEKSRSESSMFLNSVKTLYFTGESDDRRIPISEFQLIEETYKKMDVFVEVDEEAASIWEEYSEILEIQDALERYKRFARLKKSFQEYVISIPYHVENRPPLLHEQICFVSNYGKKDYYDDCTGFITKGVPAIW
jgi:CRISPR-associated endonuclease/helicase Cas3